MLTSVGARDANVELFAKKLTGMTNSFTAFPVLQIDQSKQMANTGSVGIAIQASCLYPHMFKILDIMSAFIYESQLTQPANDKMVDILMNILNVESYNLEKEYVMDPCRFTRLFASSSLTLQSVIVFTIC
jgi:hypothetical protein